MTTVAASRPTLRRLALTTVLAGGALAAVPAWGQALNTPAAPTVVQGTGITFDAGGAPIDGSATNLTVNLAGNNSSAINWNSFNVANGSQLTFSSTVATPVAVLNRVTGGTVSSIDGRVNAASNIAVWLSNSNGILVGANAAINTGALVLTTLPIDTFGASGSGVRLGRNNDGVMQTSAIDVDVNARIATNDIAGLRGPVVLVAPRFTSSDANPTAADTGEIAGTDVAFVVASDATISAQPGSPVGITIIEGTEVPMESVVAGTIKGERIFVAGATRGAVPHLLRIDANLTASATATGGIVIATGADPATTPELTILNTALNAGTLNIETNGVLSSAGDISIAGRRAGVTVTNDVAAGGAITIAGTGVTLGEAGAAVDIAARGALGVTVSSGALTGLGNLSLRSDTDASGAEDLTLAVTGNGAIAFGRDTTLFAGTNLSPAPRPNLVVNTANRTNSLELGSVRAGSLAGNAFNRTGAIRTGALQLTSDLTLTSAGGIETGAVTLTGAGLDATFTAGGALTVGSLALEGSAALNGRGATTLGAANVGGDLTVLAGINSQAAVTGGVIAGGNYLVEGGSVLLGSSATGEPLVLQRAGGTITVRGRSGGVTGLPRLFLDSNGAGPTIIDAAQAIDLRSGTTIDAGAGRLALRGTSVTLGSVFAGEIGGLTAGSAYTGAGPFTADSINAASLAVQLTTGDIGIGNLVTTGAASLATGGAARIGSANVGSLTVRATGAVTGNDLDSIGDATVSGGSVTLRRLSSANGAVNATASAGDLDIDTVRAGAGAVLRATGTGNVELGSVVTGSNAAAADQSARISAAGGNVLVDSVTAPAAVTVTASGTIGGQSGAGAGARLVAGGTLMAQAQGDAVIELARGAGEVTLQGTSLRVTQADAGGALALRSTLPGGSVTLGTGRATGNAVVGQAGDVRIGALRSDTGTLRVQASGALVAGTLFAAGAANASAATGATIDSITGSSVDARAGSLNVRSANATATTLTLAAMAGPLTLGTGAAATSATLGATTDLTVQNQIAAGTNVAVTAGQRALVSGAVSRTGATTITGQSVQAGTLTAGTNLTISARGGNPADPANGDISLSNGVAQQAILSAAGDVAIGSLVTGGTGGTGDLTVTAAGGGLNAATLNGRGIVTTRSQGATDVTTLAGGRRVDVLAGSANLGTVFAGGSPALPGDATPTLRVRSNAGPTTIRTATVTGTGASALVESTGALTITNALTAPGQVTARASGALVAGTIESTAGSVDVTGASASIATARADANLSARATAGNLAVGTGLARTGTALLSASGDASTTSLTSSGTASVSGNTVRIGTVQTTGTGDITVAARGALVGVADRANLLAAGNVGVTAAGRAQLGLVAGNNVTVTARDIAATTATARSGDLSFAADGGGITAGSLSAAGATTLQATTGIAATRVAGGTGAASAVTGGAAQIGTVSGAGVSVRGGSVAVGVADSRGALTLAASAGPLSLDTGVATGVATLTSGGAAEVGTLRAAEVTATAAGALAAAEMTATNITLTGASASVERAAATQALVVRAGSGTARIGSGNAGTTATLTSAGGDAIVATSLRSEGATTIAAAGTARLANVSTGNGVLSVAGNRGVTGFGGDNRAVLVAGGAGNDVTVTSSGNALLGVVTAADTVTVRAGGLDASGLTATAGVVDAQTSGALTVGTAQSATSTRLVAGGALNAGVVNAGTTAELRGGSVAAGTLTTAGAATVAGTGPVSLGTTLAGGNLEVTGGGVTLGTTNVTGTARVTSTAALTSGSLDATGDVTLAASGGATLTSTRSRTGAIGIETGGAGQLGSVQAATALTVRGTGVAASNLAALSGALDVQSSGPLSVGTASSGTTTRLSSAGTLSAGSVAAGSTAELRSGGGLSTGILTAGGNATVIAAGAASLGTTTVGRAATPALPASAGSLTVNAAGITAGGTTVTGGTASLTSSGGMTSSSLSATGNVTLSAAGATTLSSTQSATGSVSTQSGGAARLGTVVAAGAISAGAASVDATRLAANGGALTVLARGGSIAVGEGNGTSIALNATGAVTTGTLNATTAPGNVNTGRIAIDAGTLVSLGQTTAARTIRVTAADAAITGLLTAAGTAASPAGNNAPAVDAVVGSITFSTRNPARGFGLGSSISPQGFQLSNSEVRSLAAPQVTFMANGGDFLVGDIALPDATGSTALNLFTTGRVRVTGTVTGSDASARTMTIGSDPVANAQNPGKAGVIRIDSTASAGGRLLLGSGSTLVLNGGRIVQGQTGLTNAVLRDDLSGEDAARLYTSDPNSLLYVANPAGVPANSAGLAVYQAPNTITAGRLAVNYDTYALFQNTGSAGRTGSALPPTAGAIIANTLTVNGRGAAPNSFALFGTVNNAAGQATAISTSITIGEFVTRPNSRVNGCLLGSGGGCLTTTLATPVLNVFDSSRLNVLSSVEDFSVPFDPVVGGNNEALFAGVSAIDVPITSTECDDGSTDPQCTGGSNQQETRP